jgi:hypothetical protein
MVDRRRHSNEISDDEEKMPVLEANWRWVFPWRRNQKAG